MLSKGVCESLEVIPMNFSTDETVPLSGVTDLSNITTRAGQFRRSELGCS